MDETIITAGRRVVRFYRIDEAHGGLPSLDTIKAIETLDKQVRREEAQAKAATAQLDEIASLTAAALTGAASPADLDRLRAHLHALGVPAFSIPSQEASDGPA